MAMNTSYFEPSLNIDRICRICLLEGANLSPIFCSEQEVDEFSGLQQKIQLCGSIEIHENDGFPSLICDVCIYKASIAHEFRQQCQQSDARLRLLYDKPNEANIVESCTQTEPQTRIIFTRKMPTQSDGYYIKDELQESSSNTQEYATAIGGYTDANVRTVNRNENPISCQEEKLFLCNIASFEETKEITKKEGTILAVEGSRQVDLPIVQTEITTTLMTVNADGELETRELIVKDNNDKCNETEIEEEYLNEQMLNENVMEDSINADNSDYPEAEEKSMHRREEGETMTKCGNPMKNESSPNKINEDGYFALISNDDRANTCKTRYSCNFCSKHYVTEKGLKNHMKIHEGKSHDCRTCRASFTKLSSLNRHLKSHEDKINDGGISRETSRESMDVNNTKDDEKTDLETDEEESCADNEIDEFNNAPGIYKCEACDQFCSSLRNLERHSLVHGEKKYSCTVCQKRFFRPDTLKKHAEKHGHGLLDNLVDDNKLFESDDENFSNSAVVKDTKSENGKATRDSSDNDGIGEYKCQHCDKIMATKKGLRRHVSMHKPKAEPVSCNICKKVCASQTRLGLHLKTHNKPKEKPQREYLCHICSKVYPSNSSLTYHMRTHTGVKPHVCKICNSGFTTTTSLANHIRIHTGDKPFVCHVCSAAFAVSSAFRRHLTRHTGEANYLCKTCGKAFKRLSTLKEHTYTHSGEKPYVCKTCGAAYSHSGSLFAHQKRCRVQYSEMIEEHNVAHHIHVNNVQTAVRSLAVIGQMY